MKNITVPFIERSCWNATYKFRRRHAKTFKKIKHALIVLKKIFYIHIKCAVKFKIELVC